MPKVEFELMTKPLSVNRYYSTSQSTRRLYITTDGAAYKKGIQNGMQLAGITKLAGNISLDIQLKLDKKRKMDIDNCLKPLLDSLQGYLYDDDSQVQTLTISKQFGFATESVKIIAQSLD